MFSINGLVLVEAFKRGILRVEWVKLREAEILLNQGDTPAIVRKKIGVSDCT